MLIVRPEDIEGRFGQRSTSTGKSYNVGTLGHCNLGGDQANDLVKLEGTVHGRHFEGRFCSVLFCG